MNFEHWNKYVSDTIRQLQEQKKETTKGSKTAATKGGQHRNDDRNSKGTAPGV